MSLDETLAFVTVAELGSFTAAGDKLGVPKSTLSRQVSRLEERLGARLLQRTTRRLSLTELGEAYYQRCHPALEEIADAERIALDVSGHPRGTLRVSMPFDLARDVMVDLIPEFCERYPEIDLSIFMSQRSVDLVAEGFDVALRGGNLPDAGFIARRLAWDSLVLCAAPSYLDARGRPGSVEALAEHDGILMGDGRQVLNRLPGPEGMTHLPLREHIVANEWGVIQACIRAGMGVGPLRGGLVVEDFESGALEWVLPELGMRKGGGLFVVYPSKHHLSPKVRVFVDFVQEKLPPLFAGNPFGEAD